MRWIHSLVDLLYPPLCLHCANTVEQRDASFCASCQSLLELIHPDERCPHCFSPQYHVENKLCLHCKQRYPVLNHIAAAFDYIGPAATLVKKMKYSNQPHLAKGAAGYMVAQFLQLNWSLPDMIIPIPMPLTHWIERGYNQSELLAQHFSNIIGCPVQNALERRSGDYSQAGLTLEQRKALNSDKFYLKNNVNITDKTILLIDDVMTSGSTMRQCAEVLFDAYASSIYGLTLCRAIK